MKSDAGRPIPVPTPRGDVARTGWGANPDAESWLARHPSVDADPPSAGRPPPLPPKNKPPVARRLLEDLAARDERAREAGDAYGEESMDMSALDVGTLDMPTEKKGISLRLVRVLLLLVVAGGIAAIYWATQAEPEPTLKVDEELVTKAERRRRAVTALERGHELVLQGPSKADEAIEAYTRALELDPELAAAERGLGVAYAAKKDETEAITHYRRYLKMKPDASDADEVKGIIKDYRKRTKKRSR